MQEELIIGDIIAFKYPEFSDNFKTIVGKIIQIGNNELQIIDAVVQTLTHGGKTKLCYQFPSSPQKEPYPIGKSSVIAPILLNANGTINKRTKYLKELQLHI